MSLAFFDPTKFIDIISLVVLTIIGVVYGIIRFFQIPLKKDDNFIAIHTEIHELLTELRLNAHAMRSIVLQFHNGEYFMDGISMRKFSITHESAHKGYVSQAAKFKNVLCSLYIPLLNKVLEDNPKIYVTDILTADSYAKHFLEDENISNFACLPLKNKGVNVGFILVQWHKDFPPQDIKDAEFMDTFEKIRDSIEVQLSYQKK